MVAKSLGKPTVVLRSDFRRTSFGGFCEPYNLMVKNWPRSVEVQLNCFGLWAELLSKERQVPDGVDSVEATMRAELGTVQASVDEISGRVVAGFEAVLEMGSPFPPEYREVVYQASRFSTGSGFSELMTEGDLEKIVQRIRRNGTL